MWLPRPVYEAVPYACMVAGAALAAGAFVVAQGPRGLLLALGGALVTLGLILWMRRRACRASLRDYDGRPLDG